MLSLSLALCPIGFPCLAPTRLCGNKSRMEIDNKEHEAPKGMGIDSSSVVVHPLDYWEESKEPTELVDLLLTTCG